MVLSPGTGWAPSSPSSSSSSRMPRGAGDRLPAGDMEFVESDDDKRGPPKREAPAAGDSPPKQRRGEGAVTEEVLRQLLADTTKTILAAQQDALQQTMDKMDRKNDVRFGTIETELQKGARHTEALEEKIAELSLRVGKIEEGSTTANSEVMSTTEAARRKLALVIGGFPKDTKRAVILHRVSGLLQELKLNTLVDESPFCTGPRRTCALLPFRVRPDEALQDARDRLHRVLSAIVASKTKVHGMERPLWAGISKTPAERLRSGHCTFLRRVLGILDSESVPQAEHDYQKGTTWLGDSMLSCTQTTPPRVDAYKIYQVPGKAGHWVNISAVAHELKLKFAEVESALHKASE